MSRLRIVCKSPAPIEKRGALVMSTPASFTDVFLTLVSDDGTEHEITNVEAITWRVKSGSEVATATIEFSDVDVDVEGEVEATP